MIVFVHKLGCVPAEVTINVQSKIGRGATATVYKLNYDGHAFAAKIFHNERRIDSEKVLAMLANTPENAEVEANGKTYPQFAWPCALLKNSQGEDIGYLMPLVDTTESHTLDYYYDQGLFDKLNSPSEAALSYKLEIAQNLSTIVAELHKHQHYIIDCKPQNIRVFKKTHLVSLIDCDGFSIFGNGRRYPAELLSTDYIAPEAQRQNSLPADLAEPQDRYALAVILFQLLNRGTHPFQGILATPVTTANTNDEKAALGLYPHGLVGLVKIKPRPQSIHHLWDLATRRLFDQAFTAKLSAARPSAQEWADHFRSLLENKAIVRCDRYPDDFRHIRFRDMGCPTCYIAALSPHRSPVPTTSSKPLSKPTYKPTPTTAFHFGVFVSEHIFGIICVAVILFFVFMSYLSNKGGDVVSGSRSESPAETSVKQKAPIEPQSYQVSTPPIKVATGQSAIQPSQVDSGAPQARTNAAQLSVDREALRNERLAAYRLQAEQEARTNAAQLPAYGEALRNERLAAYRLHAEQEARTNAAQLSVDGEALRNERLAAHRLQAEQEARNERLAAHRLQREQEVIRILKSKVANPQISLPYGYLKKSGLVWAPIMDTAGRDESKDICSNSTALGYDAGSWRQPTKAELHALYVSDSDKLRSHGWALGKTRSSESNLLGDSGIDLDTGESFRTRSGLQCYVACVADRR